MIVAVAANVQMLIVPAQKAIAPAMLQVVKHPAVRKKKLVAARNNNYF